MIRIITILCISFLLKSCLVSRCLQPKTTGYVYDFDSKKPLLNCSVDGMLTDSTGYYEFKEIRYREFTFAGFEAAPVNMVLIFNIDGYISDTIKADHPYGGGMRRGAHWQMDTVFLKRK